MTAPAAVPCGELIDKITILEIKRERMTYPDQLANVEKEYEILTAMGDAALPDDIESVKDALPLKIINDNAVVDCRLYAELHAGAAFWENLYQPRPFGASNQLTEHNESLNSDFVEEKSYKPYD
mgnify:CR=1 FL=1